MHVGIDNEIRLVFHSLTDQHRTVPQPGLKGIHLGSVVYRKMIILLENRIRSLSKSVVRETQI